MASATTTRKHTIAKKMRTTPLLLLNITELAQVIKYLSQSTTKTKYTQSNKGKIYGFKSWIKKPGGYAEKK